jgi:branched-subunit amino acid transport protein
LVQHLDERRFAVNRDELHAEAVFPRLPGHGPGSLREKPSNQRLLAGLIAVIVAYLTKNTLVTILAGMLALLLLQVLL